MSAQEEGSNLALDPEVRFEQEGLARAHRALVVMRARAEQLLEDLRNAGKPDLDYELALVRRVALLEESRRPLLFGRIIESSGLDWRIGRRHVEESEGEVLVVDWRAPVAVPFYRARPGAPVGLRSRRQIMVDGERVVAIADDLFDRGDTDISRTRLRGGDALLRELERSRTGEMLDIIATIQYEQDEIIRGPLEGLVVVQGGPGTGKTAVGLHRAAFLLYNHVDLARSGVLVVGPSRAFLRYIAQVLPSLGEEAVLQTTVGDLGSRVKVRGTDPPATARAKGDPRMAEVIRRALALGRAALRTPVPIAARHLVFTFEPDEVNALAGSVSGGSMPYKSGRATLRTRLVAHARQRLRAAGRFEADEEWFAKELATAAAFGSLLDELWPTVSPNQLVSDLLSKPSLLRAAAHAVLDHAEIASLLRPRAASLGRVEWTADDLALLDEANFLINGRTRSFGHIVCDEAQDLSPMQFRMLARRSARGSLTILGDIAQATGPWSYQSWEEILPHLPEGAVRRDELTLGYRSPAQILDLASRLLPTSAPLVKPTSSARAGRFEPVIRRVDPSELAAEAIEEALALANDGELVGLIVPLGALAEGIGSLARRDDRIGNIELHGISRPVTVVPAPLAKGLEFDSVVLVEPTVIAGDDLRGLRLLYVAMTRPIHRLVMLHAEPLPEALLR